MLKFLSNLCFLLIAFSGLSQNYTEVVKLLASDMNTMDKFGRHAVAIDGDYAFVGAHYEQEDENGNNPMLKAGSVYIFQRDANGNWTEVQKIVPSDRTIEARFGYSISLSGNTAVIGAYLGNPDSINTGYQPKTGTAYVFELQPNGKWFETQKLYSDDGMTNDGFGCTVGISNGVIAIGARTHPLDVNGGNVILGAGAAYTFEKNGSGIWIQKQKLVSDSRFRDDLFGYNLAMDENLLVVGPHLFKKDTNGQWVHQQELMADQVNSIKNFEISVDISGEHIIIGNPLYDPNRVGQAYIFEANVSGKWLDQQLPIPLPHIHNPRFGTSVSIDGHRAFVSNTNHSLNANDQDTMYNAGATYMFQKNWNGQWLKQQKIVPNDRSNQDQFGEQTDIFNNFIIISSRNDTAITSSGVLNEPGAVYIFETPVCIESDTSYTVIECDSFIVPSNSMIYTAAGNYLVKDTIPNHCGGDSLLYIDLTILPPKASIINPTICYNDTVFVNNTPYHALNPIGIETIANVGPYNCDSIITIDLNVLPKNEVTISGILCEKDSLIVNGTIYHSGNLIGTETFVNIGPNGCDSTVNINLTKYSTMNIQFDSIDEVCENEEVVFTANIQHGKPPYSYLWSYNNLIGTIDNFMITASSTDTANISLWVTDHCNIAKKREQTVAVSNCQLVIPNIITPNGDGINDYFEIIGLDFGSTNHIQIFNRWGVLLFEQYNYLNNWDANKMPDGVYYYSLVIKNNGEEKNYSGPLTILRQ